jgi:hypothetical protein
MAATALLIARAMSIGEPNNRTDPPTSKKASSSESGSTSGVNDVNTSRMRAE